MRLILGLFLTIISFLGILFFRHYSGTIIPYPSLWYILFIIAGLSGLILIFSSFRRIEKIVTDSYDAEIEKFKISSEKIELNFDFCEFKSGSYSHQVENENISSIKQIAPPSITMLADTSITENVTQSYLVYNYTVNGKTEKYTSQSFPFDPTTLRFYVLNQNISLYVDWFDRTKYFFDLKRQISLYKMISTITNHIHTILILFLNSFQIQPLQISKSTSCRRENNF